MEWEGGVILFKTGKSKIIKEEILISRISYKNLTSYFLSNKLYVLTKSVIFFLPHSIKAADKIQNLCFELSDENEHHKRYF